MTIAFLFLAALFLAYANGANDNFKAAATVYGSGALGYRKTLALVTAAQLTGSMMSLILAGTLVKAFSGKGLVPVDIVSNPFFLIAVGLGAALTVILATRFGLPISTTHALIGGLMGAGLAFAPGSLAWSMLGSKYFLPLLISPVLALCTTAVGYPIVHRLRLRLGVNAESCVCVEAPESAVAVSPEGLLAMGDTSGALAITVGSGCEQRYTGSFFGVSAQQTADAIHMGSAFALGFARGLNDTAKVLGLLVAATVAGIDMRTALIVVAVVMAIGGLLHSRRLAETLGKKITPMNTGQGLLANLVSSSLVIGASLLGSGVSTTHVSTGAIFGIGLWTGRTDWRLAGGIVLAWVATLPFGATLAFGIGMMFGA